MCRILYVAKTANIGYTTSMAVKGIPVPSRGMRQMDVHMVRCVMSKWINIDDLPSGRVEWDDIFDTPSIDIVRCAECKYKQQCHKAVEHTTYKPTSVTIAYRPIDFCSYGERRE